MANRDTRFLIKRSNVPGKIPTNGDLLLGELGLNTADAILYTSGTTANSILPIGWDRVSRTGDTMTGGLFTPFLTATTISATSINTIDYIVFNTGTTSAATVAGTVYFDNVEKSLSYNTSINQNVTVNLGQQNYIRIFNNSGVDIQRGKVLELLSSYSGLPSVTLAVNKHTGFNIVGVSSEIIPNNSEGIAITYGIISNIELTGITVGSLAYASDTEPGNLASSSEYLVFPLTARTNEVGYVVQTGTTTGKLFVNINNENSVLSFTDLERNMLEGNTMSTGLFEYSGMTTASTTTFNIAPLKGFIIQNTYENSLKPNAISVEYSGTTGLPVTNISLADSTYILINSASTIVEQITFPTPQERRENIYLGKVNHPNRSTILNINNTVDFNTSPMSSLRDLWSPIRLINQGIIPSPNGSSLSFKTSAGILWGNGINWYNNQLSPNDVIIPAKIPASFNYRTQTGGTTTSVTNIDPRNYDVNGVITSIGAAGINDATNQRIYLYPTGVINILYGQTKYASLTAAVSAIQSETFVTYPNALNNGILIGVLSVRNDIGTDGQSLSNPDYAKFTLVSKFGESFGNTGGLSTTTLQQAYDNSSSPEIITNSTLGALSIKNGTGNADNVTRLFEGQTGTNGVTSVIYADGYISGTTLHTSGFTANSTGLSAATVNISSLVGGSSIYNLGIDSTGRVVIGVTGAGSTFTGGTVTGPTDFTAGLTSTTITATSYFGLPTDAISVVNTSSLFSTGLSNTGFEASGVTFSNFFGTGAGYNAGSASYSNFLGNNAGYNATNASGANFIGRQAGYQATNATSGHFIGTSAGYNATNASYSVFIGQQAGYGATNASNAVFIGNDAGDGATTASGANFIGGSAGYGATNASYSNFMGWNAGYESTGSSYSNFFGYNAGQNAGGANNSNFIGRNAGDGASSANYSNFMGYGAGLLATVANNSNFIGVNVGYNATDASNSNFIGKNVGFQATGASYSNLFGFNVGYASSVGNSIGHNNIIIGTNISLSPTTSDSINIGGILFGSGTHSTTTGAPSITPISGGKIGIGVVNPLATLHVNGDTIINNSLTANTISATTLLTSGFTANSTGLSATTVSATTYYNLPTDTLQQVYTASTAPRITTNNTLGSLRVRGGTGSDSDNNFIIENNVGDVTSYWSANGDLVLQTISATTYYNLPLDVYVTGGSYNQISGIATFTNNTGGTFTVNGFSTGGGGSFTGGTVTGPTNFLDGLSANTMSATTYYNLPTDVYVTGGTYSNGSTTFTNITGGTFDVTGYYTGNTDVYVTGGTYTEGVTTFENNTGGTFNVTTTTNYAAGVISGSTGWSSTGTGQINLPNVKVALYNNANNIEPILIYNVASGTTNSGGIPSLANNDTNYIVIEYNGGSPIYNVYDNDFIVDDSSVVLFMVVYRADNFIHTLEFGNQGAGLANKLNDRFIMTDRIGYESGLALGLSGSTGIVTSTAGVAWNGPNRQFLDPVNSQDDIFFKSFHSGGTWVYTTTGDTINNTYYDDGTDIVSATAGKYLTNWYFRGQEINDHLYEVYSTNEYDSVALAQLSTEPILPELITSHAILLGRIIVLVGANTGLTESAFVTTFQPTNVTAHNDLNGIQGGTAGQYYHLNANQYNNIALTNTDNNFSTPQSFNSGVLANTISATTVTANSSSLVSMSATTLSGETIYGDGSNITNIPIPYGIINAISTGNFLS